MRTTRFMMRNYALNVCFILLIILPNIASTVAATCESGDTWLNAEQVISMLQSEGFTGLLDDRTKVKPIGTIIVADTCLHLLVYVHTSDSKGGAMGARHMAKRLLIFSKSAYLGMYAIDEFPTSITGNVVKFPGNEAEGNRIVFDSEAPPKQVYLNGEVRMLFK